MPSCSDIDLTEIRLSSKISSWIWSIISGVVTVLGRPGRGASQVEKSPRLNWATQLLMVACDGACSHNISVRMAWISLGNLPCRKKETRWQLTSRCCWNRARRLTCFLSASVTRKDLQFGTWTNPSFQRHYWFRPMTSRKVRAKDFSALPRTYTHFCLEWPILWPTRISTFPPGAPCISLWGGTGFLWNVGTHVPDYRASHIIRKLSSIQSKLRQSNVILLKILFVRFDFNFIEWKAIE